MELTRRFLWMSILTVLPATLGCNPGEAPGEKPPKTPSPPPAETVDVEPQPQRTAEDVKREAGEAFETSSQYAKEQAEELHRQLQRKIDELGPQIERLKSQARDLKEQAKPEWDKRIAQLEEQRRVAQQKLDAWKKASPEAWKELKTGASRAWSDLKESYDNAARHFENADGAESSKAPDDKPQE